MYNTRVKELISAAEKVDALYAAGLDAADADAELEVAIEEFTKYGEEADVVCAWHVSFVSEMDDAPMSYGEQLMVSWCFWNSLSHRCCREGHANFASYARHILPFLPGVTDLQIVEAAVELQVCYAVRRQKMRLKHLLIV